MVTGKGRRKESQPAFPCLLLASGESEADARKQVLAAPAVLKNKSSCCAPEPLSPAWRHSTPCLPTAKTAAQHPLLCYPSPGRKAQ